MGSSQRPEEQPAHVVEVRDFLMGMTVVTQGQWQSVMDRNPSRFNACGPNCPVDSVGWKDVQEFISRLNRKTGKRYRLPSEAEWEYAARAGTTTEWSFGNDESKLGDYAFYTDNSGDKTQAVRQKLPNAFGLYDMHGNVRQWVEDCWHQNYFGAPANGNAWTTDCANAGLVLRGGSWFFRPDYLRSARRSSGDARNPTNDHGFRLARDL